MKVTLEDLLHAINNAGEDREVMVDGFDSVIVTPPVMLTPYGRRIFGRALNASVEVDRQDKRFEQATVSDYDPTVNEQAHWFLEELACRYPDEYDPWFNNIEAELV